MSAPLADKTPADQVLTLNLALEDVDVLDNRRAGGRRRIQVMARFTRPAAEQLLGQLADALGVNVPLGPNEEGP